MLPDLIQNKINYYVWKNKIMCVNNEYKNSFYLQPYIHNHEVLSISKCFYNHRFLERFQERYLGYLETPEYIRNYGRLTNHRLSKNY